jgi:hypothetical protein
MGKGLENEPSQRSFKVGSLDCTLSRALPF